MPGQFRYPEPIVRLLDIESLAEISDEDAEAGEEIGLEGNQLYSDLRWVGWDLVAQAIDREEVLFARFEAAESVEDEAERYAAEIAAADSPEEDFLGLDVGVISAVLALSALGALTFSSCNAGGFGGRHLRSVPVVEFYLPRALAVEVLEVAEAANVGLAQTAGGLVRLYGETDYDLHRFATLLFARHAVP
ncbi:hypothetical protein [Caulobacter sp. LARHSG274]